MAHKVFERPHHQRIAHVLLALDGALLRQHGCLFGGGTCMALRHGEYRESVDMDFLVSDATGYRELRQLLTGPTGIASITRPEGPTLSPLREIRADQYGIRTQVQMDCAAIKFEIVREARFTLQGSGPHDTLCGVSTLTALDLATAIDRPAQRSGWLERCMRAMGMTVPQAVVWQRVRALRRVLPSQR